MALQIFEMTRNLPNNAGAAALRSVPWNAVQSPVDISGTSNRSAAFASQTRAVSLISDVDCHVEFGDQTVDATAASWPMKADEAQDFWLEDTGLYVAVIAA